MENKQHFYRGCSLLCVKPTLRAEDLGNSTLFGAKGECLHWKIP